MKISTKDKISSKLFNIFALYFSTIYFIYCQPNCQPQNLKTDASSQSLNLSSSTQIFMVYGWVSQTLQSSYEIYKIKDSVNDPVLSLDFEFSSQSLKISGQNILNIYQQNSLWLFFLTQIDQNGSQLTVYFSQPQTQRDYYNKFNLANQITLQSTGQITLSINAAVYKKLQFINGANFASSGYQNAQSFMFQDFQGYLYSFKLDQEYEKGLFKEDIQQRIYPIYPTVDNQVNSAVYSRTYQGIYLLNNSTTSANGQNIRYYSTFQIQNVILTDPFFIGFYFRLLNLSQNDNNIIQIVSENQQKSESLSFVMIQNSVKIKMMDKQYQIYSNNLFINQWYYLSLTWNSIQVDSTQNFQSQIMVSIRQQYGQAAYKQIIQLAYPLSIQQTTYSINFGYIPSQFSNQVSNYGISGYISKILIGSGGSLISNTDEFKNTCKSQNQCEALFLGSQGTSCQVCSNGYLNLSSMDTNTCSYTACPSGYYFSNEFMVCQQCNQACQTCFSAGNDSCSLCLNGYYQYQQICFKKCPEGFYISDQTNFKCERCNASCSSCTGPSYDQCLSCKSGFYLSSNTCQPCNQTCTECTDMATCQSCISGYYLDTNNSCISSCPNGQFPNVQNQCQNCSIANCYLCSSLTSCTQCNDKFYLSNSQCLSCDQACTKCFGPTQQQCFGCIQNKYLYNSACLSQPNCTALVGYFPNFQTSICQACQGKCKTCTSQNTCSSCINGYYLQDNNCLPCPSQCSSCQSSTLCSSCYQNYYLDKNNNCSVTCPNGTFGNSQNICQPCINGCLTCYGPTLLECFSCQQGFFFQAFITNSSQAIQEGMCIACSQFCLSCTSRYFCTACKPLRFMKILPNLNQQTCVVDCGSFYLSDETDYTCKSCLQGCETCSITVSNCQTCIQRYYNSDGRVCNQCLSKCLECSQIGVCTSCANGFYLQNNSCQNTCLQGFSDSSKNLCVDCHPTCVTCQGPLATDCLTCISGYYLNSTTNICQICDPGCYSCSSKQNCSQCNNNYFLYQNYCYQTCPNGTYPTQNNNISVCLPCTDPACFQCSKSQCILCSPGYFINIGICSACDSTCKTCLNQPKTCTSCDQTKNLVLSNTSCVSKCGSSQYVDPILNKCLQCFYSCSSCFGPNSNQCFSCQPNGFYLTNQTQCSICDQSCLYCSGPGFDSCTQCAPGYYKLGDSVCVQSCPDGFFLNTSTNQCQSCNQVCYNCNGPQNSDCTSCAAGYYQSISNQNGIICSQCNSKCLTCNGPFSSNCILCNSGYVKYNSQCQNFCPQGFRSIKGVCVQCPSNCGYCINQSLNSSVQVCTQCLQNYILNQLDNTCVQICPTGTFQVFIASNQQAPDISSYYCQACDQGCISCSQSSSNCSQCKTGYIFHETVNQCVYGVSCLNGFILYIDSITTNQYCKVCKTNCVSCIQQQFYYQENCYSSCPVGTVQVSQSNICVLNLLPQLTILTNPAQVTFKEDVTILTQIKSPIKITSMAWSLISPSPISDLGSRFLQNLILNNITNLYIPLQNLSPLSIYQIQFTIANFKGSTTQTISLNTQLMLTPGTVNCQPSSNIFSGTTQIQLTLLNFIHPSPLLYDYVLTPIQSTYSFQRINNITTTAQDLISADNFFVVFIATNSKQLNLTTYQVRQQQSMNVVVNVFNQYVSYQTSSQVEFLKGSAFTYNTTDTNQDLNKFDSLVASMIANTNQLTQLSTFIQDIRTLKEVLYNYLQNAYSQSQQQIYLQKSFFQVINSDISCQLNLCMNSGKCIPNSIFCSCPSAFTGPKCQIDIKRSQQLSSYLEGALSLIYQNMASNINNDGLINILMDISFFRDMLDKSVYPVYFQILAKYFNQKLTTVATSQGNVSFMSSITLSNCFIQIFENLNPIIISYNSTQLPDKPTYLQILSNIKDLSIINIITNQNSPLNVDSPYYFYASIGVITSSMFPQILNQYQNKYNNQNSASFSSFLLMRNLQLQEQTSQQTNSSQVDENVGQEFGTGIDVLKSLFNFPVIEYQSKRHFIYLPQSIITSFSNFRIIVTEVFDIVSSLPYSSQLLSQQFLLATGFFTIIISQSQQIIPIVNYPNPITIIIPKMVSYPSLNYVDPKLPVYNCLHYDQKKDEFESNSCFFQRENSTHIACSCYTIESYITVQINKQNIQSLPVYNDIILSNNFTFDAYVTEKLRVYKEVNKFTDPSITFSQEQEKFQQLMILKNYYGLYIMIIIALGIGATFLGYSSIKSKYFDEKINMKDHSRIYFLYYFPIISFLAGPTNQFVNNYTRAVTSLTIIASHFAFSSIYIQIIPFDIHSTTQQILTSIITVSSTSVCIYWTIGVYHMIVVGLNNNLNDEKNTESTWKIVEGFKYSFGVTMIALVLAVLALISISVFIGLCDDDQFNIWQDIIKAVFLIDLIADAIVVFILIIVGYDSTIGSFFALRGYGITIQSDNKVKHQKLNKEEKLDKKKNTK
ncbi:hypothetical protein ABPG72_013033 [Tetrahymena utriculariae]